MNNSLLPLWYVLQVSQKCCEDNDKSNWFMTANWHPVSPSLVSHSCFQRAFLTMDHEALGKSWRENTVFLQIIHLPESPCMENGPHVRPTQELKSLKKTCGFSHSFSHSCFQRAVLTKDHEALGKSWRENTVFLQIIHLPESPCMENGPHVRPTQELKSLKKTCGFLTLIEYILILFLKIFFGAHGWFSQLRVWLLISAQVMIPGSWDWALCWATWWAWRLLKILSLK